MRYILSTFFKPLCALALALNLAGCSKPEIENTTGTQETPKATHSEPAPQQTGASIEAKAAEDDTPTVRSAESHVHGGAVLSIVTENNKIAIEFETPLYNLLGFEYAPQTPSEKTRVTDVEEILSVPQNLIRFNKLAQCTFQAPTSEIELFEDHADQEDHHESHEDEDEHHDDDEHHDEHKEAGSHKDVILSYRLTCQNIDKLQSVRVEFFDVFSNFTELELVYLGPTKQMSADLTPSRPSVDLTR